MISATIITILLLTIFVIRPQIFFPTLQISTQESNGTNTNGSTNNTNGSTNNTNGSTNSSALISGFNFSLETGTYWHYYWTYEQTSLVQGSGGSGSTYTGDFTVTLGEAAEIEGVKAYRVETSGNTSDPNFNYAPRWTHLAVSGNRILGSDDNGVSLKVIFDARTSEWKGGGFFSKFPDDLQVAANPASISNEYINTSAYSVGQSKSEGGGFYDPETGVTVYHSEQQYSVTWDEYYKGGLGPIGYYYNLISSNEGGGFYTAFTHKRNLGLVASSLTATDGFAPKLPPWIRMANMPTARSDTTASTVNDTIYVIGGFSANFSVLDTVEAYNPATNTWTTKASLPVPRVSITSVVINGLIYVAGQDQRLDVYDPATDTWSSNYPSMPAQLYYPKSAAFGRYMVVIGRAGYYNCVLVYDTEAGTWFYGIGPPYYQSNFGLAATSTHVYTIGDYSTEWGKGYSGMTYQYDPYASKEEAWKLVSSMSCPRTCLSAVTLNGTVYAIGGCNAHGATRCVEAYNPDTNTWTVKSNMPTARLQFAASVMDGKIYTIGGTGSSGTLNIVEEYDPSRDIAP